MLPVPGEQLNLGRWELGHEFVEGYLSAVGDRSPVYVELEAVPPLALAARALGALLQVLSLPPGTVHAAQEMNCKELARLGDEVSCTARLSRAIRRGDWRFMSAEYVLCRADGEVLLEGKSNVLIPVSEAEDG